ncbi:unnamed protein product [Effrenium voratum]|uniref:Uncharacterized protein n=1 Tax=Effrenium voratum TaxID=2562239 RepID=A0AA36HL21_9DINO|nr:unnamed protein product [Effrenium voratum]CAJ1370540.1 unnamed protein product [Effrenium voratum]
MYAQARGQQDMQQPYGSLPGSFPPPQGTFAAMQQGYLGQGLQSGQSAGTYGGPAGVPPGAAGPCHPAFAANFGGNGGGYRGVQPGFAPGGFYGHGAQQVLAKKGLLAPPKRSRQKQAWCC